MDWKQARGDKPFAACCIVLLVGLAVLLPVDYLRGQSTSLVSLFCLSAAIFLWVGFTNLSNLKFPFLFLAFLSLIVASTLVSRSASPLISLLIPIVAGVSLGVSNSIRAVKLLVFLSFVNAGLVSMELLVQQHFFLDFLGTAAQMSFADTEFRARGALGQPVASAMFSIVVFAMAAMPTQRIVAGRYPLLAGLSALVTVLGTGTRAALLLLLLLLLLKVYLLRNHLLKLSPAWVATALLLCAIMPWTLLLYSSSIKFRVLSFDELADSASYSNREMASRIFTDIFSEGSLQTIAFGHGYRALQEKLRLGVLDFGFSTVDNIYVTITYDFGTLGLTLLIAAVAGAAWMGLRNSGVASSGALGMSATFLSGLFFDSLYTRSILIVFGVAAGLYIRGNSELAVRVESTGDDVTAPDQDRAGHIAVRRR